MITNLENKNNFYDQKIIILDLNFMEIEQQGIDEYIYTKKLINELASHQNLILTTDNSSFVSIPGVEKLGLKTGYLISDSGSIITNIANKKTIDSGYLGEELVIHICNACAWNNLHFSIISLDCQYPFNISNWLINKYQSDLSHIYNYMGNNIQLTSEIKSKIKNKKITKIEIYFLHKDLEKRKKMMLQFISVFEKEVDYSINSSYLHVFPKNKTKFNSLKRTMKELNLNLNLNKDGLYFGVHQFDQDIHKNVFLSLVNNEIKDRLQNSKLKLESVSIGNISWIKWFYNHEHLWHGEAPIKIEKSIKKYKEYSYDESELIDLQIGKSKNIQLQKEVLQSNPQKSTEEKIQLSFWSDQIETVSSLIRKYISKK